MLVEMRGDLSGTYKSASQIARVVTEAWVANNLFCAVCDSMSLNQSAPNHKAIDFTCPACDSDYQLKSRSTPLSTKIVDAGYEAMKAAILAGRTPNLLALRYDPIKWRVMDLIVVPRFAYSLSSIERRKPLSPKARRAGWVGCNIVMSHIPPDARIQIVQAGVSINPRRVREQYSRLRPLEELKLSERGWTLDVLNVVRELNKHEFTLQEVYAHAPELAKLHPDNRHVQDKIRQQLQVLRDKELLQFLGRGKYGI